jgi:hypothetical protein
MNSRVISIISAAFILAASTAYAGVSRVSKPTVSAGEVQIQYSGTRYDDDKKKLNNKQAHNYEIEYGFSDRFKAGIEGNSERKTKQKHEFTAYGVEAQYVLTKQKSYWMDSAIKAEYAIATQSKTADQLDIKWLAAKKIGNTNTVVNVKFGNELGDNRKNGVTLDTAVQTSYKMSTHISPGIEWHAEYGKLNALNESKNHAHYVGPIITGELFRIGQSEAKYTTGYFVGMGDAAADSAARLQVSYNFPF